MAIVHLSALLTKFLDPPLAEKESDHTQKNDVFATLYGDSVFRESWDFSGRRLAGGLIFCLATMETGVMVRWGGGGGIVHVTYVSTSVKLTAFMLGEASSNGSWSTTSVRNSRRHLLGGYVRFHWQRERERATETTTSRRGSCLALTLRLLVLEIVIK